MDIIDNIPILDNFKRIPDEVALLKGPPRVTRYCFLFEVMVAAATFAVSFYISITSTTTTTTITYEPLTSSDQCDVLSPRSDSKTYSAVTSELVMFSSARYLLDDCLDVLDTTGLDVCADGNRKDAVLSVQGVYASAELCFDLLLPESYRLCYGSEVNSPLRTDLDGTYPRQTGGAPPLQYEDVFYFANRDGAIKALTAPFAKGDELTQYLLHDGTVYVVASKNAGSSMYALNKDNTAALALFDIAGSSIGGLAISDGMAHVLEMDTNKVRVHSYELATDDLKVHEITCTTASLPEGSPYQLISVGDDGYIYLLCSTVVQAESQFTVTLTKVHPTTFQASSIDVDLSGITVENDADDDTPATKISSVVSLLMMENAAYLGTGAPDNNLIRVNMTMASAAAAVPTRAPTAAPSPQRSASPTVAGSPLGGGGAVPTAFPTPGGSPSGSGPPPGPGPLSVPSNLLLEDVLTQQSDTRRILTTTLTSLLIQATGLDGTPSGDSLHQLIVDHVKRAEATIATPNVRFAHELVPSRRLTASNNTATNLGQYKGTYLHRKDDSFIYFQGGNGTIFNITANSFSTYDDPRSYYYTAKAIQLAYSYGICNGAMVSNNWTISTGSSSGFFDQCGDINGIYFQNNLFFEMPEDCAGLYSSPAQATIASLAQCAPLAAIYANFTSVNCASSFEKICAAEYTDNPPFSCTSEETPDFLTTLGSALANASALWSFLAVAISVSLKRMYPGGVKFLPHTEEKVAMYKPTAVVPADAGEAEVELQKMDTRVDGQRGHDTGY